MQNYYKAIGAMVAASALVAGNASAEVEYEIHTGYSSNYIFRGIDLGSDLVETGVDVSTEMWGLGLSAGAWYGSFETDDDYGDSIDFDELDLYAEVSKDLGFLTAAVGYIHYFNFGNDNTDIYGPSDDDAQEVYFSISKEFYGFETSLTYFWDIETDNDGYSELFIGKGYELNECLTLNVGSTLGYLVEEGDLSHFQVKVALDWAFTETATLSPFIAHSWALSEGGRHAGGYAGDTTAGYSDSKNELFAGTMLSVSF